MYQSFFAQILAFTLVSAACANLYPREKYERMLFDHLVKYKITLHDGDEFVRRVNIFANNFDAVEEHEKLGDTVTLGMNEWSHLTLKEFHEAVCIGCFQADPNDRIAVDLHVEPMNPVTLPSSVDWSTTGAVTSVKYQGPCGGCWAFSAVGALEGSHYLKYGSSVDYSEQELISCSTNNHGCGGGSMNKAFNWVKSNGGLTIESAYPCTSCQSGQTGTCQTSGYSNDASLAPASITNVVALNVNALQSAVAQQPVSIAIDAGDSVFQSYRGGIISSGCGTTLNHAVLLVGYGRDSNGINFWKIKNSWGTGWGESGYVRIKMGSGNQCGVLSWPSYPNL